MSRGTRKPWSVRARFSYFGFAAALAIACGGSAPAAEEPEAEPASDEPIDPQPPDSESEAKGEGEGEGEGAAEEKKPAEGAATKEPEFKDGGSVSDAINAVPQGTSRVNIDQETLSKPLANAELYAPCKLAANQHFKVTIAVWNGRTVGVDLTTQPVNKRVAECIDKQVRGIEWSDKVKSLNTVEYSF
jgi:hypothetical protein